MKMECINPLLMLLVMVWNGNVSIETAPTSSTWNNNEDCKSNATLCSIEVETGYDLSLTCMADSNSTYDNKHLLLYCDRKGGGKHFRVIWYKQTDQDKKIIIKDDSNLGYKFENDAQTLSLLTLGMDATGIYESSVQIYAVTMRNNFTDFHCTDSDDILNRLHSYRDPMNVTLPAKYLAEMVLNYNCTFNVTVIEGAQHELKKQQPYPHPWKLATVYVDETTEAPSLNYRYMDGDFEYHEVIEDPYYQRMPEKHVMHDSHQEIITVVKRHQAAVFTCHVRTAIPLTSQIYWLWEKLGVHDLYYEGEPQEYNLTDDNLGLNITQRRWSLWIWNVTSEDWGYSNLTCVVSNQYGIAKTLHKIELIDDDTHNEHAPAMSSYEICPFVPNARRCIVQHGHNKTRIMLYGDESRSNVLRLCMYLSLRWVYGLTRYKVTFNIVPRHCRSYDEKNPYHNCSLVRELIELQSWHFKGSRRADSFRICTGVGIIEGWADSDNQVSYPESTGYGFFWKVYNYKYPANFSTTYIWIDMSHTTTPEASTITTKLPSSTRVHSSSTDLSDGDKISDFITSVTDAVKSTPIVEPPGESSENDVSWTTIVGSGTASAVVSLMVIALIMTFIGVGCCVYRQKYKDKRTKLRVIPLKKRVKMSFVLENLVYRSVASDASDPEDDIYPLPEIEIENLNPDREFSRMVNMSDYEIPVDLKWEISRERLKLGNVLGQGEFGIVRKGILSDQSSADQLKVVAVKMLKETATDTDLKCLLAELLVMKHIAEVDHPNVIKLLGCRTQSGPVCVVLEYAEKGNLRDYLRKVANELETAKAQKKLRGHLPPDSVTVKIMLKFASEIACGMMYIASLKIIHRDLAARNILVTENQVLKITDFGFTRILQDSEYYRVKHQGVFPVKWMSPEAITNNRHTTKSDVWSFGIVLWELFSMGGNPYGKITFETLLEQLNQGYRMNRPANCPVVIYDLMLSCWEANPKNRPSFKSLQKFFNKVADLQDDDGLPCQPDKEAKEAKLVNATRKSYVASSPPRLMKRRKPSPRATQPQPCSESDNPLLEYTTNKRQPSKPVDIIQQHRPTGPAYHNDDTPVPFTTPKQALFMMSSSGEVRASLMPAEPPDCDSGSHSYSDPHILLLSSSVEKLDNEVFRENDNFEGENNLHNDHASDNDYHEVKVDADHCFGGRGGRGLDSAIGSCGAQSLFLNISPCSSFSDTVFGSVSPCRKWPTSGLHKSCNHTVGEVRQNKLKNMVESPNEFKPLHPYLQLLEDPDGQDGQEANNAYIAYNPPAAGESHQNCAAINPQKQQSTADQSCKSGFDMHDGNDVCDTYMVYGGSKIELAEKETDRLLLHNNDYNNNKSCIKQDYINLNGDNKTESKL